MVEMLVVVVLGSFLLLGVIQIFLGVLRGGDRAGGLAELRQAGDYAMLAMERRIREGKEVTVCNGSSLEVGYVDGSTLSIELDGDQIVTNGEPLTGNDVTVSSLSFTCTEVDDGFTADKVSIEMELYQKNNQSEIETFQSTVSLRNL